MLELSMQLKAYQYVSCLQYPALPVTQLGGETCDAFNASWDRLEADAYLGAQHGIRKRRICKFEYLQRERRWKPLDDCRFYQSATDNPLLGGLERIYARSEPEFTGSPVLMALLAADLTLMDFTVGPHDWQVTCHQFRTLCDPHNQGQATPEGRHRDGHDFVFQHLIKRESVTGGESRIYREHAELVFSATLTRYMETIVLNDRALLHEVSPLQTFKGAQQGWRDMLIIDFDRINH
ncbi:2OG-Fe dioxygenase family protein [Pseudomonas sp. NUPR-001]|uniref:2OG-Fe dioxygenase family protein n=1 Tax=Pseudomonas sp. NUPR-001 TaxID=3416058 RepID=UPI003F9E6BEC